MDAFKKSIIIDIDGTLYDKFPHDDRRIIAGIFKSNVLVKVLDKFLWTVNSLDFITNSMGMLNLRLKIYSMLSFKNFSNVKDEYRIRYQNLLSLDMQSKVKILREVSLEYNIILVTNNAHAVRVLSENLKYDVIYAPNINSRRKQIKERFTSQSICFLIGNNYTDDIFISKILGVSSIYVGKSIISKLFNADFNIALFEDMLKIIKGGS